MEIKKEFYKNGKIKCIRSYVNNQLHNEKGAAFYYYYENGKLKVEAFYKNGKYHNLNGPAYLEYNEEGVLKKREFWIENKKYSMKEFNKNIKNKVFSNFIENLLNK